MTFRALLALAILAAAAAGPSGTGKEPAHALRAFVGIPPAQYVVDRIGGRHVATEVLVAPGQSPHTFDATPRQMVALAESDVYLSIGLPFEQELLRGIEELNPDLAVVDMGRGVPRRRLSGHEHEKGQGGSSASGRVRDESERAHTAGAHERNAAAAGLADPHIWLAPRLLQVQAANVAEALIELDPASADGYRSNLERFLTDLAVLDRELAEALAPARGKTVYVFHPAFGYFTDAYGLDQVAVETGGSEPGAKDLAGLIDRARADGVSVIFVQPQFARKSAEAVAREIGGTVVPIDPLAYDVAENLRNIARKVGDALTPTEH